MRILNGRKFLSFGLLACTALAVPAASQECENGSFDSTFALIQQAVFENRGCTASVCHGAAAAGGLDLQPEVAHRNLVDVDATTVPGMKRVWAGQKDRSLLFVNLAAKTLPGEWTAPLRAMPLDPVPALTENQLEAVRRWIEAGAPATGTVPRTDELLDACLPPPEPIEIKPLPPPAPGTGVQIRMPRWTLGARSEKEVCFAAYYDVSGQVPPQFLSADGQRFRFSRSETRQDPLSHHLIVNVYEGAASPDDPVWGTFRCRGGARDGETCRPTDIGFCGADAGCATDPRETVGCIGIGPEDSGFGLGAAGIVSTQETASDNAFAPGVYSEAPLRGMILWDSHAFNLQTDKAGKLEAWVNFYFAPPEEQLTPAEIIFDIDRIFSTNVAPFQTQELCHVHVLPPDANLYELSSHMHRFGKRWRTFEGAWSCAGGPNAGQVCSRLGVDLVSPEHCPGSRCLSLQRRACGDCNYDGQVSVAELVTSVNVALGAMPMQSCEDADFDADGAMRVDELVTAVNAALDGVPAPVERDPDDSLLYVNLVYSDPLVLRFETPRAYPGPGSPDSERSLTYCALFDNGYSDPSAVKRRSTSPPPPTSFPTVGGPCARPSHCAEGRGGESCAGESDAERHASCDTSPGAGDGICDACRLRGGATSEDEMFILMGQYFVR